jgi:signal transduction histidine kinase
MKDIRPLDPVHSIRTKLGVLVAVTIGVAAVLTAVGIGQGLSPVYTVPVVVLGALAVTRVLARGMTSPLREMTAAARAMARGDYTRRVRASSRDEVGQLAHAFNRMAADLEAADRQRRDLVANVSHELRTPISALQAVLENLVDGVTTPDDVTLRAALEQTERLGRLVEQLLDLSRVESGSVPLDLETFDVAGLLAAAVRESEMTGRPVRHVVAVQPEGLRVRADEERLRQLLANLLDNAGRHSPPDGTVTVSARASNAAERLLRLEVADEGPGIAPHDRGHVFERFIRGGAAQDGGTGLGLAIARWVTDLHDGTIEVTDTEGVRGCTISVVLPLDGPQPRGGQA